MGMNVNIIRRSPEKFFFYLLQRSSILKTAAVDSHRTSKAHFKWGHTIRPGFTDRCYRGFKHKGILYTKFRSFFLLH